MLDHQILYFIQYQGAFVRLDRYKDAYFGLEARSSLLTMPMHYCMILRYLEFDRTDIMRVLVGKSLNKCVKANQEATNARNRIWHIYREPLESRCRGGVLVLQRCMAWQCRVRTKWRACLIYVNVLVEKRSRDPIVVQVPLSVLGVDTDSVLSCAATSTTDPTELLLLNAANSFLSCSISWSLDSINLSLSDTSCFSCLM
jgi:hypothetical protein